MGTGMEIAFAGTDEDGHRVQWDCWGWIFILRGRMGINVCPHTGLYFAHCWTHAIWWCFVVLLICSFFPSDNSDECLEDKTEDY